MGRQIDFDKALGFTKLSVYLACTWPPSSSATKWKIVSYNVRWCICFVNALSLCLGLIFSIYKHHDNSLVVTQSACFVGSTTNLMIKMIVYRIKLKPTQTRIEEIEDFLKTARPYEKAILQRYLARCSKFHVSISILNYLTAMMVICAPFFFHHQPLPTMAVYPFPVDSGVAKGLVYLHQCIVGLQCSSGMTVDCQAALMMWYAGAGLEILAVETKSISEDRGLPVFVEKHTNRMAYAVDVSKSMRYVALASSMASGLTAIMSSLLLFGDQSLVGKLQYVPVAFIAVVNLFVCAWPADNLINACYLLGNAVYNVSWFGMPVGSRKNLLIIIRRCQRPITVSVGGLLPILSLRSYATFLSAVFSYFMSLRAMTSDGAK